MAGKITIRRIGSMLPTMCLLLVLLVSGCVLALSTLGFPAAALRYVEKLAAEQGITLRVEALYLYPSRGLAVRAEGVQLYESPTAAQPLASVGSLSAGLNVSHLLMGSVRPSFFMLTQGQVQLPVTEPEGEQLRISDISLAARMDRGMRAQITSGFMRVQGIPIRVQGSCDLTLLSSGEESSGPLDIHALLAEQQSAINTVYSHIRRQEWPPELLPSLELRLAIQDEFRIHLLSSIPSLNLGQFHFRDARVDLQYNKKSITINSLRFRTVDPEATVSFQGGYEPETRRLNFRMQSNAALMRMVRSMSEGALRGYLEKFRHPDDAPPSVQMSGDICFEEDYTLQSARARGSIVQKELSVGSSRVVSAELSFFYDNGDFNIDKLDLEFEDGSLQCIAAAQEGVGKAELALDLPVQRVLTLAHELGAEDFSLPAELALGERVQIQAHARLTTPAFKPGQTHWQGFVPTFHMLAMECRTSRLSYGDYCLEQPALHIRLAEISQRRRDFSLRSLGGAHLQLEAEKLRVQEALEVEALTAKLTLEQLTCTAEFLPRTLEQAELTLAAQKLTALQQGEEPRAVLQGLSAAAKLHGVNAEEGLTALRAQGFAAQAQLAQAAAGDTRCESLRLEVQNEQPAGDTRPLQELLLTAGVQAAAQRITRGETAVGAAELCLELPRSAPGRFSLLLHPAAGETACTLSATPTYSGGDELLINNIRGEIPRAVFELIPPLLSVQVQDLEMPEQLSLSGSCALELEPFAFRRGAFQVEIPQLVRTPWRQRVFAGKRIPLKLHADALLNSAPGGLLTYRVNLLAEHETGRFEGLIVGSSAGALRVTGTNTIRPDIVDQLIDNEDAHSILRDFRFPAGSSATIRDIDARIDLADGLRVESMCGVELHHAEYLISVIEDTADGGERVRSDLGSNPYTRVNNATCEVQVHVIDGCHGPGGAPIPDECVITIHKPVLIYDNSPWLSRCGWKSGTRESRLDARGVIIDIEHSFVELQDVRGTVYPAYSLGMFYPDLQHYMEDVILPAPVRVESEQCVFPIYSDCVRPMSGVIRALSPGSAGFRFLGTTIPLEDFSGFINLTDDYVLLDRMNARSWEGVLNATVKIGISGKRTSFDGYVTAQCMNLQKIAASYDSKQAPALCNADIRFRSPSPELKDIKAYGRVDVEDGDLMTLSLFKPVSDLITDLPSHFLRLEKEVATTAGRPEPKPGFFNRLFGRIFKSLGALTSKTSDSVGRMASNVPGMNHLIAYDLKEAHTNFDIVNGYLITRDMKVTGYNLNVSLNLAINLDTMELSGNLWPRISSLPTILLSPFTFLSDFMVDIILYGKVDDIKWRIGLDRRAPTHPPTAQ